MDHIAELVLLKAVQQYQRILDTDPGTLTGAIAMAELNYQRRHGARYSPVRWFGERDENVRKVLRTRLYGLRDLSLIDIHSDGPKMSHVKPTKRGIAYVEKMLAEEREAVAS